jgi:hypothetical protein
MINHAKRLLRESVGRIGCAYYAKLLDNCDPQWLDGVKFGPDIGQLTKGSSDAVQVVKDYLPLVQHMHLKDYNGVDPHLLGYCP